MKEVKGYHRRCSREMSQLIMSGSLGRALFSLHCTIFSNFLSQWINRKCLTIQIALSIGLPA